MRGLISVHRSTFNFLFTLLLARSRNHSNVCLSTSSMIFFFGSLCVTRNNSSSVYLQTTFLFQKLRNWLFIVKSFSWTAHYVGRTYMHAWATLATEIQSIQRIYCFLLLPLLLLLLLTHFPRWLQIIALRYPLGQPTGCIRHRRRRRRRHAFSIYFVCACCILVGLAGRTDVREGVLKNF